MPKALAGNDPQRHPDHPVQDRPATAGQYRCRNGASSRLRPSSSTTLAINRSRCLAGTWVSSEKSPNKAACAACRSPIMMFSPPTGQDQRTLRAASADFFSAIRHDRKAATSTAKGRCTGDLGHSQPVTHPIVTALAHFGGTMSRLIARPGARNSQFGGSPPAGRGAASRSSARR